MGFSHSSIRRSVSVVLVSLVAIAAVSHAAESKPKRLRRIAIAPFRNVKKKADVDWLNVGLGEAAWYRISCIPGLNAISPSELMGHLERAKISNDQMTSNATARKIGELAKVERVLLAGYVAGKGSMIVNAKIVHGETGKTLATKRIQVPVDKILDVPARLALFVAESYRKKIIVEEGKPRIKMAAKDERIVLSDEFKQLIRKPDTDNLDAFAVWCGGVSLPRAQWQKRADHFLKAVELDPKYGLAHWLLGDELPEAAEGDTDAAKHAAKGFELLPNHPWSHRYRAMACSDSAKNKEDLDWLLKRDQFDWVALEIQGGICFGNGDSEASSLFAKKLLQLDPHEALAHAALADLFADRGEHAAAVEQVNHALETVAPFGAAKLYALRAVYFSAMGQADKSAEDIKRALAIDPTDGWIYAMRASRITPRRDTEQRIKDLSRAIELGYLVADVYTTRGWLRYNQEANKDAVMDFSMALRLDPTSGGALVGRGMLYVDAMQYAKGIADFTVAIENDPDAAVAYRERALAYCRDQKYELAIEDINRAIELNPRKAWWLMDRAIIYQDTGRLDEAIKDANRAIEMMPKDGLAYCYRAYMHRDLGQPAKGLADLKKAQSLGQQVDQESFDAMGRVD